MAAPTTSTNLFPPLVPSSMPSFIRTGTCRVYFALSIYNKLSDLKRFKNKESNPPLAQVTLVNQTTNKSALKYDDYPSEIKITEIYIDAGIKDEYKYYIEIPASDLQGDKGFELNQLYKVQIRLMTNQTPDPPQIPTENQGNLSMSTGKGIEQWLQDNRQYFSEWSRVCLIKGISEPNIQLTKIEDKSEMQTVVYPFSLIAGTLSFADKEEKEYLKSYNIKFRLFESGEQVFESEEINSDPYNNPNSIYYQIPYELERNISYILSFTYVTNNLYTETKEYIIKISRSSASLAGNLYIEPQDEFARMKITLDVGSSTLEIPLQVKRASSKSNFKIYETLFTTPQKTMNSNCISLVWYDTSIESGIWYKYKVQQKASSLTLDDSVATLQVRQPKMCVFEDAYLTCGDRQLRIMFNPSVSDFKYNVTESQQVALGGQYPFVKRNGNNYFRTFSIGGLISSAIDSSNWYDPGFIDGTFVEPYDVQLFTNKEEIYGDSEYLYEVYNDQHNITDYNDYIYEREFRKKIMQFLYQNNAKIFRSLTQGNILVKLMNITFQPEQALGRRLYSFSATAVEVDDLSVANYAKYDLLNKQFYSYYASEFTFEDIGDIKPKLQVPNQYINNIYKLEISTPSYFSGADNNPDAKIVFKTLYKRNLNGEYETHFLVKDPQSADEYDEYYTSEGKNEADTFKEGIFYGLQIDEDQYYWDQQYFHSDDEAKTYLEENPEYNDKNFVYGLYDDSDYDYYTPITSDDQSLYENTLIANEDDVVPKQEGSTEGILLITNSYKYRVLYKISPDTNDRTVQNFEFLSGKEYTHGQGIIRVGCDDGIEEANWEGISGSGTAYYRVKEGIEYEL